ncbi:MAG: shikimate kinase [Bacteroidota bacterium]|nr:shikimate kinase [Bacteroidota bacterium]
MKRIFLMGYMGAGKTTVGKKLAQRLNLSFTDLDWFIEHRHHKTINQIFADSGEAGFRKIEKEALHEVGEFEDALISVGGGTPCFFDNIEFMGENGISIYLKVSPTVLSERLCQAKQSRPLLKDKSDEEILAFITEALAKREPFYERATLVFDASELNTREDIDRIVAQLAEKIESMANN